MFFRKALISILVLFTFYNCFRSFRPAENVKEKYTLMVYMVGSDLESDPAHGGAATRDIKEMQAIGSTPNMNVIVATGGAKQWKDPEIDPTKIQRWYITNGGKKKLDDGEGNNMAQTDTLYKFILYSMEKYPADKYGLILWNHGAGSIDGYGFDENNGEQSLKLYHIRDALDIIKKKTGRTMEFVGFDACLMANLEAAYALSPYADFLVASEELEPGHGWDYRTVLKPIAENPNISGRKLGREIAVGYEAHALVHFTFSSITLSVIQLKQLEDVISALDVFVKKAGSDIKNKSSMKLITKARARAEDYGNAPFVSSDMVDLVDMAYNLKDKYPDESKKLIEAVGKAVSYKIRGRGRPRANGISIYFPSRSRDRFIHNSWMYQNLPFSEPYKAFIKDYSNKLVADKYPVRFATTPKAEGSKSGNGKEKIYSIEFDPRESGDVAEVYSILAVAGGAKNPHIKFFLGLDDNVALSGNTASYRFEGQWLTLNGNYAPMFLLNKVKNEEGAEIKNYAIPVRVNGNKMDIMVLYDSSTKKYEILGARNPPDPKTGKVSRFLKKLEKGDKIIPQWRFYDSKKNYKGTKDGKEFVIEDELQISSKALPVDKAEFFLGFYSIDDARNESYSEYIRIE